MALVQQCIPSDEKGWNFLKKRLPKGWSNVVDVSEDTITLKGFDFSKTQFAKNPHFRSCLVKACRPHLGKVYIAVSAGNGKLSVRFQEWVDQKSSDATSVSMAPTATDALTEAEAEAEVEAEAEAEAEAEVEAETEAEAVVETPTAHAVVETPTVNVVVETPTVNVVVETPTVNAVVETPTAHAVVETPTVNAVVEIPTTPQKKHTLPTLGRPVKPKGESGVSTAWGPKKKLSPDF